MLLPATTALATIHPRGRELGILAGANVVMPNLSPKSVREKYALYDGKSFLTGYEFEFEAAKKSVLFDIARSGDSAESLLHTVAMDIYYGKDENEFERHRQRVMALERTGFNAAIKGYFTAPGGAEVIITPENK